MKTTRPAVMNAMFRMSSDDSDQAPNADPASGGVILRSRLAPLRQPRLRQAQAVVDLRQRSQVDLELLGDLCRQALDLERVDGLQHVRIAPLDRCGLTGEVDGHLDSDLFLQVDLVEIDVDRSEQARVALDLAYQHLLGPGAVDNQVYQVV